MFKNFSECAHGNRFHLAEGCECEGCLTDGSDRPTLAEHGWHLDEGNSVDGDLVWAKGSRRLNDSTGEHWAV